MNTLNRKNITIKKVLKRKYLLESDKENTEVPIDAANEEDLMVEPDELTEGDDAIEMDMLEGDKIVYGSTFSPMDGDEGDESEDLEDLPDDLKRQGRRFDSTLSSGGKYSSKQELEEWEEGLFITEEDHLGIGYGKNDYSEDD